MTEKYITKAEVLEWIQLQLEDFTVDDIPNRFMKMGNRKVDAELVRLGMKTVPSGVDANGFLKEAACCFVLSLACNGRLITQTSGEILSERFMDIHYQYQRVNPLFFFATGSSKPFMDLLPAETLRMVGFSFIRAYKQWRFVKATGNRRPKPVVVRDGSSRGKYWNEYVDSIAAEDALVGEYKDTDDFY